MNRYIREPINGLTHLAGAFLAAIGLVMMVIKGISAQVSTISLVSLIIFGVSMISLYSASATYHMVIGSDQLIAWLRRLDHSMIYILIAGTYTPFCIISLNGTLGWTILGIIWLIAISGILFKLIWFHSPRWLSTALYILMGWLIIFAIVPLSANLATNGLILLIAGGIIYTLGGIIYATKPKWLESKYLGFHEVFHLFILTGSFTHFLAVYSYLI
ncbi:PAQR family membrane homeostasis protein TrhA [Amphibacillus xylanus]|uniref:Putative hemolysin n=1 Tax=Amphibacillus xylanus (strain ATCC 51415 / DSM 6626 / JCM 7361 / LMG 17667 / NBRC 15112 / Ep01) TaxID=698758 RepID=K0J0I0_AMPXN|nr:hemolysin III family protein [Amphibacillus xylanus]BAM48304.1 putative hemolysin [Amphibacillus xylanus NBRC 15112]